jgi:hypothetical protein
MIRKLLRLPSPGWENELATEFDAIDDYLKRLDSGLVGAKTVRRLTLLEARDFLLAAVEHAPTEQRDQAIAEAIEAFGDPAELARNQRNELYRSFRSSAISSGLTFAILMLIMSLFAGGLTAVSWLTTLVMFVVHAVFFGVFMGFWATFCFAQSLPTLEGEQNHDDNAFVVSHPRSSAVAAWLVVIAFSIISMLAILGLGGIGIFGTMTMAFNLMQAVVGIWIVTKATAALLFKIRVSDSGFVIQSWRRTTPVSLHQITEFTEAPGWYVVFPSAVGQPFKLQWQDEQAGQQSMILGLNGELRNADRFQALIEQALDSQRPRIDAALGNVPPRSFD